MRNTDFSASPHSSAPHGARGLAIPLLACLGLLAVSAVLALWRLDMQKADLRERFLGEAVALAQALSFQPPEAFSRTDSGASHPAFIHLSCQLHRLARFSDSLAIWTQARHNGIAHPGPSSRDTDESCHPRRAPPVAAPDAEVARVLHTQAPAITGPYRRDGQELISALAPVPSRTGSDVALVVGIDIPLEHWRAALLHVAILPLALGGFLILIFGIAAWIVTRGTTEGYANSALRYLEPLLAAMTGVVLSIAATGAAYQLERHVAVDLAKWTSARMHLDLGRVLADPQTQAAAGEVPRRADPDTTDLGTGEVMRLLKETQSLHYLDSHRIDTSLVRLGADGRAYPIGQETGARGADAKAALEPVALLSAGSLTNYFLPLFGQHQTLAVRIGVRQRGTAPLAGAAFATAIIGALLTVVATLLVIWLRGRLTAAERLLNQRTIALQQREENFGAITRAVRDAIIMMDKDSRIVYWNPAAEQLFGYTEGEALGQDLHRLIATPTDADSYHGHGVPLGKAAASPNLGRLVELNGQHRDGTPIPLELSLSTMHLDGRWHALGVLRDVSERKRRQERLVKLNDCLAHLGADYRENIQHITQVCGEILDAGVALYNRLEHGQLFALGRWRTPDDLPASDAPEGHVCYDLIIACERGEGAPCPQSQAPAESNKDALYLEDLNLTPYAQTDPAVRQFGLRSYFGHVVRCANERVGSLCVLFAHPRAPSDEEKRMLGILAAALTTEENRHLTTRELELSEKRMSLAMRSTGIGVWEYEHSARELRLDAAMHCLLGLEPELATRPLADWLARLPSRHARALDQGLAEILAKGGDLNLELSLAPTPEAPRHLRLIGSAHGKGNDHGQFVIGVCYDITRRKEAVKRLRLAKDMAEKASRLKTQFLSQISHELRTPMNAVLGFAQLLDADGSLNQDQRENVGEILLAGQHLLTLIDEVLDLARIESGETDLRIEDIPVALAIEESLTLIRAEANVRGLRIEVDCPAELTVAADPFRFRQILANLLTNAVKFNRPGGMIRVEVNSGDTDPALGERARINVRDTGTGIAVEELAELFEPFRRLPDAQLRGVFGAGVGLAVVRRLVELMRGTIGVDSIPGEGSCFWFELPRQPEPDSLTGSLTDIRIDEQAPGGV